MSVTEFTRTVLRFRWPVIIVSLVLTLAAASGARFLELSTDYRIFFSPQNPQLQAFEELERRFTQSDNVLFVLVADEGTVFTPDKLAAIGALTDAAWQLPYSIRVDSLTNFQHSYAEGDDLIVESLAPEPGDLTPADVERIADIALNEPLLSGRLVNEEGTATLVAVTFQLPEGADSTVAEAAEAAQALADEIRPSLPGLSLDVTGIVMLDHQFAQSALDDQTFIYPIMSAVLLIVSALILRSILAALVAGAIVVLSSTSGLGLAGWVDVPLTSPAAAGSVLILIIAVADSIHVLCTTAAGLRRGLDREEAIVESLRLNAGPIFLTSVTTIIGFLSLNWSDAPPFRHFGNIAAVGTAIAWALSMLLLPALMSLLPEKSLGRGLDAPDITAALTGFVVRRGKLIVAGAAVLTIGALAAVSTLTINDSFIRYFSTDTGFRQASDRMQAQLPGLLSVEFVIESGEPGAIADPDYLEKLDAFTGWLEQQPEVGHVSSIADIMRRLNRNMHDDDPEYYRLPEERELAAQYLLLYELSLPYGLDLNNQIDVDKAASRVTAALKDVTTAEIREIKARAEDWLAQNFPSAAGVEGTGVSVIFSFLTLRNVDSMLKGTGIAFVLISICLMIALRSIKLGALSLVINVLPVIIGFGLWAVFVGEIGIYASFVAAAAMGLIVDFTVHILSKYLRARREQESSPEEALAYAYRMVGVALWTATAILLAGFAALALSDFTPSGNFGIMTAVAIACALIADFLVLPQLVLWVDRQKEDEPDAPPPPPDPDDTPSSPPASGTFVTRRRTGIGTGRRPRGGGFGTG